jgi:predicted Rossmann fold nucleotide-binding protein DprA/Smf involved in DNA uptake
VLIAGSRNITSDEFWSNLRPAPSNIISGGARGVDQFGEEWAWNSL